ncbi:MAG TPA: hypothetical protein V6D14_24220 [Coleofasciculaceae cyanobacterium]|jgi:hypothetical protein
MPALPSIDEMIKYLEANGYKVEKRSPGRIDSSFLGLEMSRSVYFDSASSSSSTSGSDVNQLRLDCAIAKEGYHSRMAGWQQVEPTASSSATLAELRTNAERARIDANNIKATTTPQSLEELRREADKARLDVINRYR